MTLRRIGGLQESSSTVAAEREPVCDGDNVGACDVVAVRVSPPVTVWVSVEACVTDGESMEDVLILAL